MKIILPQNRLRFRRSLLLLAPLCALGCRGDGDRSHALLPRPRDPLMGTERIPPQGVPVPNRDRYGAAPRDPLLTGTTGPTASKVSAGSKEPFRLNEEFTPAAMATRSSDQVDPLIIDDRRATGVPTSGNGVRPAAVVGAAAGNWEQLVEDLRKMGGKPYAPVRLPSGDYEFRCGVPLDKSGAMRQYTGTGATPLAAVTDAYEQVRAERK